MIKRLRRRFVAIAMLSVFLVLLVLIGSINWINFSSLVQEADRTITTIIDHGGTYPTSDVPPISEGEGKMRDHRREGQGGLYLFGDKRNMDEMPFQTRYFTVFFDAEGNVSSSNLDRISLDEESAEGIASQVYTSHKASGFISGYRYAASVGSAGTLLVFLNVQRELATFENFLFSSILISFIGIVSVFLLILFLSARMVRPIAQSYEKQKRFITDAGHELKTPLTIINADVDVLEMENEPSEWLSDIRSQAARLSSLTNDLIYLSRMEEDTPRMQMTSLPISEVAEEIIAPFAAVARTSGKQLTVDIQPLLSVKGDQKSIEKLLSILMDNAMKYTPDGGVIRFRLSKVSGKILLSAYNTAENISKGNCDQFFDRFYRADSSRNSEHGGFGLGLAVAKAVTEAHKGKIHAFSEDGASLTIEATFPEG